MERKCLIIMPASDPEGYAQGHFNRVYQYIVVPACKLAGFRPMRADDPASNDSVLDIKSIIDCDIVVCDLSSKNSNAVYGFAIRQSINLPVVLIRDARTKMTFDIQEFGGIDYDESLRIDTVEREIAILSDALKKTFAGKSENSLLRRLGIGVVLVPETPKVSVDETMEEDENTKRKEPALPIISPLPDYVGDPITDHEQIDKIKVGDSLFHMNYGKGEIRAISKMGKDKMVDIRFEAESKRLVLVTSGIFRKIKPIS